MNKEDIEYFKNTFNIDFENKSEEEIEKYLDLIEKDLNEKLIKAQKENLELEKQLIDLLKKNEDIA